MAAHLCRRSLNLVVRIILSLARGTDLRKIDSGKIDKFVQEGSGLGEPIGKDFASPIGALRLALEAPKERRPASPEAPRTLGREEWDRLFEDADDLHQSLGFWLALAGLVKRDRLSGQADRVAKISH